MIRKIAGIILAMAFVLSAFSGCDSPADTSSQSTLPSSEPVSSETPLSKEEVSSKSPPSVWKIKIYPTFVKTRWGMSPSEVFEALGTAQADWKEIDRTLNNENFAWDPMQVYTNDNLNICGASLAVTLVFAKALDVGLVEVDASYAKTGDEQAETMRKQLVEDYGGANSNVSSTSQRWDSANIKDVYSVEAWNKGEAMLKYTNEVNRLKKEAGMEAPQQQINRFESPTTVPLCYINDLKAEKLFVFDGTYAAILKWDGSLLE